VTQVEKRGGKPLLFNFDQLFTFAERTLNPSPLPPSHGMEQRHAKTPFKNTLTFPDQPANEAERWLSVVLRREAHFCNIPETAS
jgi:hypothetical protein